MAKSANSARFVAHAPAVLPFPPPAGTLPGLECRGAVRSLAAVLIALLAATTAHAGYDESEQWFEALPLDDRTEVQGDLILLGYYNYLVDGAFGQGTFSGLTAFQRDLSRAGTGVLSATRHADNSVPGSKIHFNIPFPLFRLSCSKLTRLIQRLNFPGPPGQPTHRRCL